MEETNKNDISEITRKIGKFIVITFLVQRFFVIFLNDSLVNLLHGYGPLSKSDPIEITMIVRSSILKLSAIITGVFIFKPNIKDVFLNKNEIYKLSLKAKIKLMPLFISVSLFAAILSMFVMAIYSKHIISVPMPETTLLLSIFGILVAPIIEEFIYRGIFLNQLKGIGYSFSIIISSIYFGVMHGIGFLHAFIIGVILGVACVLTGNIKWSIIIHCIYNLTTDLIGYLFLPLFQQMSYITGSVTIGVVLLLIFLITSMRDREIKELYNKINIKNIIE
jgi:membrane protease YdiL (CAAX protease family)